MKWPSSIVSLSDLRSRLRRLGDPARARVSLRFFKTGPGEYGEGDVFVGLTLPQIRKLARETPALSLHELGQLLKSKIHEERLLALFLLIRAFQKGGDQERKKIYEFYLKNIRYVNNWDLVDASAEKIIGPYLEGRPKDILYRLARSANLWERRIAVLSTFHFIKQEQFTETLKIAKMLLTDKEDLIHKAVGWMLREIGKRDVSVAEKFLIRHCKNMPRTALRYAIEHFQEKRRRQFLRGDV